MQFYMLRIDFYHCFLLCIDAFFMSIKIFFIEKVKKINFFKFKIKRYFFIIERNLYCKIK